jgi:hypothetical protein
MASVSLSHCAGKTHAVNPHAAARSPINSIPTRINMEPLHPLRETRQACLYISMCRVRALSG